MKSRLNRMFRDVVVPSPFEPVIYVGRALRARHLHARAEQERFQDYLEELGIARIVHMTTHQILNGYRR